MKKIIISMAMTATFISPLAAQAESQEYLASERTEDTIRAKWQQAKPTYTGTPFLETPLYVAPYSAGSLQPAFVDDGERMVEFLRYLADVPADVSLNPSLMSSAQKHTVVLMSNYNPNNPHHPAKPFDMSTDFYDASLLRNAYEVLHFNQRNLSDAAKGFTDDPGQGNEIQVGHRMALLNPLYTSIGMGYSGDSEKSYSVMRGTKIGENKDFDYDYIAWPNKGDFPIEYARDVGVWSFTVNANKYESFEPSEMAVTITSETSGKTWTLTKANYEANRNNIFHVTDHQITFYPEELKKSIASAGSDTFHVTIHGAQKRNEAPVDITYDVNFFPLENKIVSTQLVFAKDTFTVNEPLVFDAYYIYLDGTTVKVQDNEKLEIIDFDERNYYYVYDKEDLPTYEIGDHRFTMLYDKDDQWIYGKDKSIIHIVPAEQTTVQSLSAKVKKQLIQGQTKANSKVVVKVNGKTYTTKSDVTGKFTVKKAAFKKLKNKKATVIVYDTWNNKIATKKITFK